MPLSTVTATISVVIPVYNTEARLLEACFASVLQQSYTDWELCVCNDASCLDETIGVLNQYRGLDPRIRIVDLEKHAHIVEASNAAAEQATGAFIAFLDHDDSLNSRALEEIANIIDTFSDVDLIYTDEDKISYGGSHAEPYFKPDWSPDHLFSVMYILHCLCLRKSFFLELGGFRTGYEGAQDYDLALRASSRARRICHIPKILYHWRIVPGSSAERVDAKPYAYDAARRALSSAIESSGQSGWVEPGLLHGTFRARYAISSPPVTLAILTGFYNRTVEGRGNILLAQNFIESILAKTTYSNYRILIVDDCNCPYSMRSIISNSGATIVSFPRHWPFNFAAKANFTLNNINTEHFILLNDDLEVVSNDWIESLLEHSQRPEIGAVGPKLLFPDGSIQHAGIVCGLNDSASHVFHRMPRDLIGYSGYSHLIRNYSAVTCAVFATRKDVVENVGRFDEQFPTDFNDVDYCLRIRSAGYRILYTPYSILYHFESSSLPRQTSIGSDLFCRKWEAIIERDPFYNPNLPRDRTDYGFPYIAAPATN